MNTYETYLYFPICVSVALNNKAVIHSTMNKE